MISYIIHKIYNTRYKTKDWCKVWEVRYNTQDMKHKIPNVRLDILPQTRTTAFLYYETSFLY